MAWLTVLPVWAKKPAQPQPVPLSTEQEQQFTYYWYAAKQAIENDRYTEALVLLEFCRMINPNDGQTLTFLAILYDGLGQKERSMNTFRQAFEADPAVQWNRYSFALLEQKTEAGVREALAVMEKAYEVQKARGGKKKAKGEKRDAKADEDLLEQMRRVYMATGQWEKAIAMQDELDLIKGFDAYSALNRYRAYASWGKMKKAVGAVDKYLELDPTNIQFLLFRMELLEHMGAKKEELYALYDRILELDPMNLGVLNNYAYHLATHKGDLQKAEWMSAITIREQPNNAMYLDTYGWVLHMQGRDDLAIFYLKRALSNSTSPKVSEEIEKHLREMGY
jgi:tetratricopeptide (TPR) repeat protein